MIPWFVLLVGFCLVLAAMYSFFFFSTVLSQDDIFPVVLGIGYLVFLYWLWQRISPRRAFALGVVGATVVVSALGFLLWFLFYMATGWNPLAAIFGTAALGIIGLVVGLRALNAIERQKEM